MEKQDQEALKNFLLDINCLDELQKWENHFNLFDVLKICRTEIRHSNVLSWLLNPNENHNLGDTFIKKVFQEFIKNQPSASKEVMQLLLMDFYSFSVYREWKNIDILLVSDDAVDMIFDVLKNFKVVKQTCGVSRKMTVFPDGKILSCQAISDCKKSLIGHVDKGLSESENIKYWRNYTRFDNSECLKCKYLGFCGGGCVASALFRHKQLGNIDKHYCYWIKNIMEKYFNPEDYLME